jgi:hypothetical protein
MVKLIWTTLLKFKIIIWTAKVSEQTMTEQVCVG